MFHLSVSSGGDGGGDGERDISHGQDGLSLLSLVAPLVALTKFVNFKMIRNDVDVLMFFVWGFTV